MADNNGFWNQAEGNWKQFTGAVKEKWGKFTDDEIMAMNGKKDRMVGKIQEKYGETQEEAKKQVDDWASAFD